MDNPRAGRNWPVPVGTAGVCKTFPSRKSGWSSSSTKPRSPNSWPGPVGTAGRTPQDIGNACSLIRQQNAGALLVVLNPLFQQHKSRIAEFTVKHRLPSMTPDRVYAEAGCLMSYGSRLSDEFRRAAIYVDKIFKGAKPGDLPVEQPTKFELLINGKTAKALGLAIPQSLLTSAYKVIE